MEEKIIAAANNLKEKAEVDSIIYDENRDVLEIEIDEIHRLTDSDIRRVKGKANVKGLVMK